MFADMLEVDAERDYLHGLAALAFVKAAAREPGEVELMLAAWST
jgi:hypothetical protein